MRIKRIKPIMLTDTYFALLRALNNYYFVVLSRVIPSQESALRKTTLTSTFSRLQSRLRSRREREPRSLSTLATIHLFIPNSPSSMTTSTFPPSSNFPPTQQSRSNHGIFCIGKKNQEFHRVRCECSFPPAPDLLTRCPQLRSCLYHDLNVKLASKISTTRMKARSSPVLHAMALEMATRWTSTSIFPSRILPAQSSTYLQESEFPFPGPKRHYKSQPRTHPDIEMRFRKQFPSRLGIELLFLESP